MRFRGPFFKFRTRIALRAYALSQGYSSPTADDVAECCTEEVLEQGLKRFPPAMAAIGDGTIIQAILDFLKSEEGQQFIKFLFELIMGLLVA